VTDASRRSIAQILGAFEETIQSLDTVLADLGPDDWHRPTGCPGWDVQDVVSHLVGVENQLAGLPDPEHELPEGLAHVRHDDGRGLEIAVDFRRGLAPAEILSQFRESTERGLALRRSRPRGADEITEGPFGWKMPYWQLLSIRTFDCFAHEQDVRRAVEQPGNLDGEAAGVTRDLIASFLPGVLASRVEGLADREVVINVGGSPSGHAHGGADRLTIAAGTPASATPASATPASGTPASGAPLATTLTMPFSELVALVCGRADVDHTRIAVSGDAELAAQVTRAMAFTP